MADETEKIYTSFLGTGWGFPPTFLRGVDTVSMISDEEDIRSSLHILLSTTIGERIMQPTYGCNLENLLFEPLNTTTRTIFRNMIERAILYFEPRIKLEHAAFSLNAEEGILLATLTYTVISTNNRYNIVFPFYLNEATNLRQ